MILGECPPESRPRAEPWDGESGRRLARMLGTTLDRLELEYDLVNTFSTHRRWSHRQARLYLSIASVNGVFARRRVLLCGRRVAEAFLGTRDETVLRRYLLRWTRFHRGPLGKDAPLAVAWLPHPSGLNRWWNAPDNRRRAEVFLGRLGRVVRERSRRWPSSGEVRVPTKLRVVR